LSNVPGFETNQQVLSTLTLCKVYLGQSDVVFAESAFENPRKSDWLNRPQSFVPRSIGQDGCFKIKYASIHIMVANAGMSVIFLWITLQSEATLNGALRVNPSPSKSVL